MSLTSLIFHSYCHAIYVPDLSFLLYFIEAVFHENGYSSVFLFTFKGCSVFMPIMQLILSVSSQTALVDYI